MASSIPASLENLLSASPGDDEATAWQAFLGEYSRLILHVTNRTARDRDVSMDRYAFVLDSLKADQYRRLRAYARDGRGQFSTWLVAVCRRLCVDEHRKRYGRAASSTPERTDLANLLSAIESPDLIESSEPDAFERLEASETSSILAMALAELSPAERLLIALRFTDGLSVPQIARLQREESPFVTYRRLESILRRLRAGLVQRGIRDLTG